MRSLNLGSASMHWFCHGLMPDCPFLASSCCSFSGLLSVPSRAQPNFTTYTQVANPNVPHLTCFFQSDNANKYTESLNRKTSASRPPPLVIAGAFKLRIARQTKDDPLCVLYVVKNTPSPPKPHSFLLTFLTRLFRMDSAAKTRSSVADSSIFSVRALQTALSRGSTLYKSVTATNPRAVTWSGSTSPGSPGNGARGNEILEHFPINYNAQFLKM